LALLRHLLKLAALHWEVISKIPLIELEREPQGRVRWLEPDEEVRLLDACKASSDPDLLATVTMALETGMRQSELFNLTWDRVDMSRGVLKVEITKGGKRREVPMRQQVYEILSVRLSLAEAASGPTATTGTPSRMRGSRRSWTAPSRGMTAVTTSPRGFMMNGGGLLELKNVGGWGSLKMVERTRT